MDSDSFELSFFDLSMNTHVKFKKKKNNVLRFLSFVCFEFLCYIINLREPEIEIELGVVLSCL